MTRGQNFANVPIKGSKDCTKVVRQAMAAQICTKNLMLKDVRSDDFCVVHRPLKDS